MATDAPILYGKYQLLEQLARGGMAEVYKAKAHGVEGFEKILVIKRILPELSENPRFVSMFIDEAKIAVTLSHANIVQVFDLGHAEGTYFIAMEYVAGMDLAALLKRSNKVRRRMPAELRSEGNAGHLPDRSTGRGALSAFRLPLGAHRGDSHATRVAARRARPRAVMRKARAVAILRAFLFRLSLHGAWVNCPRLRCSTHSAE